MTSLKIEFLDNEQTEIKNEIEDKCLITQLMQCITAVGIREIRNEILCNNCKGETYGQAA